MAEKAEQAKNLPVTWTASNVAKSLSRDDSKLLARAVQLEETDPPQALRLALQLITAVVVVFIIWASFTSFAEKAITPGEVLPVGRVEPIQHLEGGLVKEVLVQEGQEVKSGEVLMRLDGAALNNELNSAAARTASLALELERLRAFVEEREPDFGVYATTFAEIVSDQKAVFESAVANRKARREALDAQITARGREITGVQSEAASFEEQVAIATETVRIRQDLAGSGSGSRLALLEAQEQLASAKAALASRQTALGRAQAALADAQATRLELDEELSNEALENISRINTEYLTAKERLDLLEERLERTAIRAGVDGIVTGLVTERPGLVVGSGDTLMNIVPSNNNLIAEVKLSPKDVGHIKAGVSVFVRVDSYKFGRYGGINGVVEQVSADSFDDDPEYGPYFKTRIKLEKDYVGPDPASNRIVPGMTLTADIKTGEKSLLAYLLRPVRNSLESAFSER
ncbi:HlyD family type I secretion periplasmic adaptor subunit [Kordiimonas sp. SCSIO 12610]|uniref:HlyD family type I secretion periplasmic adaptor subunit n=1 Tax=Kordiimonas sp. SCSIO 12610 TaxID=2829597 RepID=UPI0021095578|nr:HlyD family type I secretion periplasmic adaptor subunit [Kordiimonas sp. SCSIO 12610]UTW55553.1 HlyD family type I secretion periplasmic adaptor subunit [Kordiimonas sp. SCSIO 12610]